MTSTSTSTSTSLETLTLLQERLDRIEHAVNGSLAQETFARNNGEAVTSGSAAARLRTLERTLDQLAQNSPVVADVLDLHKTNPSIFHADTSDTIPASLSPSSLAALVLAHTQLYNTSSANLTLLRDTPVPEPSAAAKLVELQQKIDKAADKQNQQAEEYIDLNIRSAKALEQWYEGGVLDMGERWADWEERMRDIEILVRRNESAKRREEDGII